MAGVAEQGPLLAAEQGMSAGLVAAMLSRVGIRWQGEAEQGWAGGARTTGLEAARPCRSLGGRFVFAPADQGPRRSAAPATVFFLFFWQSLPKLVVVERVRHGRVGVHDLLRCTGGGWGVRVVS